MINFLNLELGLNFKNGAFTELEENLMVDQELGNIQIWKAFSGLAKVLR